MKKIHFVGIGGIGMSALAQLLSEQGTEVSGSDRDASPVTELLESKGIRVIIGQRAENVPADADLLVYSDAVPVENPERVYAKEKGIQQLSYFAMLGEVSKGLRTVAVAGTHGKTTTTGMLAKILQDSGASPAAIIGSIVKDFGSNFVHGNSDLFVVEACEYRDHLLELSPTVLVITNIEWEHTDWFSSLEAVQETFRKAIERVPVDGVIVTDITNPTIAPLLSGVKASISDYTKEPEYVLRMHGEFNEQNARAAAAAARAILPSISDSVIAESLAAFQGTWRRFEYKGETVNGAVVYDDYAHHPTAIKETLKALRAQVKGPPSLGASAERAKIFVAFHPHLYSRTRDLLDDFAVAFGDADKVLIAPIFAAREKDEGTISNEMLAERIRATGIDAIALNSFNAIAQSLGEARRGDIIMTMGAGDIYKVSDKLVSRTDK